MNFLDAYGIAGTGTSTPPADDRPEQSLNEEVSQAIGTLGRFWGGFKKQGGAAFANARRDFTQVVTQAQRELEKFTTAAPAEPLAEDESTSRDEHEVKAEEHQEGNNTGPSTPTAEEAGHRHDPTATSSTSSASTSQSIFARIRSSLPPNVVSTVQAHLPESLKNPESLDLSQLRDALSTEFQRVQGVTRAQAEEYVHKSEVILREAMREAGEVLRDAVKVIPPEEAGAEPGAGVVWDGADVWMLPGLTVGAEGSKGNYKGKAKESDSSGRQSEDARRAVATRAESMLKQLRSNPEIIKVDPAVDSSKKSYLAWVDELEASNTGFGTEEWSRRIAEALSDPHDGPSLQDTLDSLVPSYMPEEVFWVRYFFRVYQIEQEENRRKALFQATSEKDEDFSWEDEEEELESARPSHASVRSLESQRTLVPRRMAATSDELSTSLSPALSPRLSSEDSYDLVSATVSNAGDVQERPEKASTKDDSEESDWE
ncbi:hypothetical protein EDD16DRAFT_1610647 [Pisolithus croceorrhizus]|nr:hypothetical protein EDD16DRAFT_1610647 [Pisolithus croceorrhizus]KAI6135711.1 hypothetical protein EV401DRAFT_2203325 [Pisolithus croceorrhizus]